MAVLSRVQSRGLQVGAVFVVVSVIGLALDVEHAFQSYLVAFTFWVTLALGSLALLALHHLVGGAWSFAIRRVLEAGARTIPLLGVISLPLLLGVGHIYTWADPAIVADDPVLQHKAPYLNATGFAVRTLFYFVLWSVVAYFLTKLSFEQDEAAGPEATNRLRSLAGPALIVTIVTGSFASFDWVMSLDPHWFSSLFGLQFMTNAALAALAFTILALRFVPHDGPLATLVKPKVVHDLGNFLWAFVMLWAYLAVSQYLIIWSGNTKEEVTWYLHHTEHGWSAVVVFLVLFHFVAPFVLLLSRRNKRELQILYAIAAGLLAMHWVDVYWNIVPNFHGRGVVPHWMDLTFTVGIGGLWLSAFAWQLRGKPLLPVGDPDLAEILDSSGGHS